MVRPSRHRRLLICICAAAIALDTAERALTGAAVANPVWIAVMYLAPLALWRGAVIHRMILIAGDVVTMALVEALGAMIWLPLTGGPFGSYEAAAASPLADAFCRVLMLVLLACRIPVFRRLSSALERLNLPAALLAPLVLLIFVQMGGGIVAFYYTSVAGAMGTPVYYAGMLCVAAFAVAADGMLLGSVARAAEVRREQARSRELAVRLGARLAEEQEMLERTSHAARLRHDARNHLQVLAGLIERGDLGAAIAYARGVTDSMGGEGA